MLHELGLKPVLLLQEALAWSRDTDLAGFEVFGGVDLDTAICMPNYLVKDIRDTLIEDRYCR
eukprot:9456394-Karenia_brevis.AAC.1